MNQQSLSIIVTSYTEERLDDIAQLLTSVKSQTDQGSELVYITEGSVYLNHIVDKMVRDRRINGLVLHNSGRRGLAEARNLGASKAHGNILGFVDDDVVLSNHWASIVVNSFTELSDIAVATGPAIPIWMDSKMDWFPPEFDWLIGCNRWYQVSRPTPIRNAWGMNMSVRRDVFEEVGSFATHSGYHRGVVPEDVELSLRARRMTGQKIYFVPEMKVWSRVHPERLSTRFIAKRSSFVGYSRREITRLSEDMGESGADILRPERQVLMSVLGGFVGELVDPDGFTLAQYWARLRLVSLSLIYLGIGYYLGVVQG